MDLITLFRLNGLIRLKFCYTISAGKKRVKDFVMRLQRSMLLTFVKAHHCQTASHEQRYTKREGNANIYNLNLCFVLEIVRAIGLVVSFMFENPLFLYYRNFFSSRIWKWQGTQTGLICGLGYFIFKTMA